MNLNLLNQQNLKTQMMVKDLENRQILQELNRLQNEVTKKELEILHQVFKCQIERTFKEEKINILV
ncbi:hypothetical protein BV914_09215 [Neisseria dumasiana]|nr:hypothetical protein BV914_09215 [Neisseria dumasiana]